MGLLGRFGLVEVLILRVWVLSPTGLRFGISWFDWSTWYLILSLGFDWVDCNFSGGLSVDS